MEINNIKVRNDGYVFCKSNFYSAQDVLSCDVGYTFLKGINKLTGEIDSGIWAISYLLSMYAYQPDDFILFEEPITTINDMSFSLYEISKYSCYMDKSYPMFSADFTVKELVMQGIEQNKLNYSYNNIRDLFHIDKERFERPLTSAGNESFKAMAAIGYCHNKEIFCFPWLSNKRFENYQANLFGLLKILESLGKVVIIPIGKE